MALLSLQNAQLAFGHVPLLDHTDFSLELQERVGLIGRNGTGKSSLLKILAGIDKPDDGELRIGGLAYSHHCYAHLPAGYLRGALSAPRAPRRTAHRRTPSPVHRAPL